MSNSVLHIDEKKLMVETMPQMFGQQLYPNGYPFAASNVFINHTNIQDLFLKYVQDEANADDMNYLNSYMRYYVSAPCWRGISLEQRMQAAFMKFEDLLDLCLDNGLDPF
jgi:hypothetical protein